MSIATDTTTGATLLPGGCGGNDAAGKRVLLLEDDPSLREAIRDFLSEWGHAVVEVESGIDGIREVLAGDFAVVICDMMMPGLAGDLFYRAVERARPQLCRRFIFMTGHRGDPVANEFIDAVGGYRLLKPFGLQQLLTAIGAIARRHALDEMALPHSGSTVNPKPGLASPTSARALASDLGLGPDAAVGKPPLILPLTLPPDVRTPPRVVNTRLWLLFAFGLFIAALGIWSDSLHTRKDMLAAKLRGLQTKQKELSMGLEQMQKLEPTLRGKIALPKRLLAGRKASGWASALHTVAALAGTQIEIESVHAFEPERAPGACELHVEGFATGDDPRRTVDVFRQTLETMLKRDVPKGPISVGFERLDDVDAQKSNFTIVAALGFTRATENSSEAKP